MSRYLAFVLNRAGVYHLDTILIRQHSVEWVNHQIYDEFAYLFPEATVSLVDGVAAQQGAKPDLVVLPYLSSVSDDDADTRKLYRSLASGDGSRVVLYGVMRRTIHVLPARKLLSFHRSDQFITWLAAFMSRTRLTKVTAVASRLIKVLN